jgi:NDP-sugar pyrophosphorylase family protein
MICNVLIFVGGYGRRLGNLTKKTPKPLLKFNNVPFIEYLLKKLILLNPKKIIFLSKYKNNLFKKKYHNKKINNTILKCFVEKKKLGTGGSLYHAKRFITNNTLVCNGDTFFELNFKKLNNINLKNNSLHMFLVKNNNYKKNKKLSNLSIKKGKVIVNNNSNLMNSGFYIINKLFIKFLNKKIYSLENLILKKIIEKNLAVGTFKKNLHIDIGTKKNFKYFLKYSKKIKL